ncbi:acyl-CoA-binding domain-containing protein 4 isoform X2 [Notamacropus eugenii]|uniref:acyl-CoA-binding domain-containing protein 4 isoform X2 n=1 Tax=Notamacropus eugenii TaxID=9315 RepID=UPI003B673E3E
MGTERHGSEPDCHKQFHAAVTVIQSLPKNGSYRPSYEEMLRFYSYYKQATQGPCHAPRPGFWDPIGRYKWDAWHSLGRMSQEEAMAAYIAEMKVVAQKVIDTVPLGEVDDGMFDYFVPLYEMIPDMPQPPETFLKKLTAQKKMPNGDLRTAPEPLPPPKELTSHASEAQLPRVPSIHGRASMDLDSEVFCDSLEQLEPEQGEWLQEELKEALEGETDISSGHLLPRETGVRTWADPGDCHRMRTASLLCLFMQRWWEGLLRVPRSLKPGWPIRCKPCRRACRMFRGD